MVATPGLTGRADLPSGTLSETRRVPVTPIEGVVIVLAGLGAGVINTVVGSGTLITFPVLLWTGLPPVAANVANNIGLAPGSLSGAVGYRGELSGSRGRILRYSLAALLGGVAGAILLVVLPPGVFRVVAPVLISMALVLVVVEPWLGRRLEGWRQGASVRGTWSMAAVVFSTSVYGGYFGAGQGVILLAVIRPGAGGLAGGHAPRGRGDRGRPDRREGGTAPARRRAPRGHRSRRYRPARSLESTGEVCVSPIREGQPGGEPDQERAERTLDPPAGDGC